MNKMNESTASSVMAELCGDKTIVQKVETNLVKTRFVTFMSEARVRKGMTQKDVADKMVNITKDTLKPLSSILLEDIDDTPVIRPVVDMSNIENARDLMGMYFGKGNYNQMVSTEMAQKIQSDALKYKTKFNISDSDMSAMDPNRFSKYIGDFDKGKASNSFTSEINSKFDKLAEIMTGMKVVLDTGELVGATASAYDKEFGKFTGRRERGN